MKNLKMKVLIAVSILVITSCGGSIAKQPANEEGFLAIEKELKSKFGDHAYYTDLIVSYDHSVGNMISTTVTADPESLKMGEWTSIQGIWQQKSEVTLEISGGSKAADFMFQLNDKINLSTLGKLVESAKKQLTAEKDIKNPALDMALIKFPDDGDMSKAGYNVLLEPENGGTTFNFSYALNGDFIEVSY